MGKKLVIFVLTAVLLLGTLALTTGAESAGTYEVGYSKVDINPYWTAWMEWSKGQNIPNAGTYPYQDFYDRYDIMPLPMAGYGNNDSRLSRPKLMDDNGSGVGASKTNVTRAKTSAGGSTVTLNKDTFYSYVYANNANYQDVHLSSNRYTKAFAQKMGVTYSDGIYGENDGDGVWATCVLVKDSQTNSYLLLIGVDNIGLSDTLNGYIRKAILAQPEVQALGLTEDRILINTNHTHGSVATGTQYSSTDTATTYTLARDTFGDGLTFTAQELHWYLNFYKNHLCNQMALAAVQAIDDLEPALTMEKGSIDAGQQSGHHMNGVRHNVQTYTPTSGSKPSITYVRGSSFNNYMRSTSSYDSHFAGNGFTASQPVSESDDKLHILQFTFENKDPIAMVNFRAHSTANNKEAAKALHYNISADWVSPLRYEMEQAGYRFSLLYGNSGNLGTGVSSDTNSLIPYNQAYYSATDGHWVMPATHYGRTIAQAALALLGDVAEQNDAILDEMHSVPMGKLLTQKTKYLATRQIFSPLSYAAAMSFYNAGAPAAGGRYTISDGQTVSYNGKSVTLGTGEGGTYVIASKYHANSILSRYGVTNKTTLELNTIRLGSQVAMYTTPIEAADRYFINPIEKTTDILANASLYNDWWNLNEESAWGTPFDLSLTNGSSGYITNELAYDYNSDYTGTDYILATGSYESQNSNHARGEGEKIVAVLNGMLRNMEDKTAYCTHCQTEKTFKPLELTDILLEGSDYVLPSGHYFLAGDFAYKNEVKILEGQQVCLDLNSYNYSCECYTASSRAFEVQGTLNVMDLAKKDWVGRIQGLGVKATIATDLAGGTMNVVSTGTLNLYNGILTQIKRDGYGAANGGVLRVAGTFNMYGGGLMDGQATGNGGNLLVDGGTVTVRGGVFERGTAGGNGGNVYIASGRVDCYSAGFTAGTAVNGGSVYVAEGSLTLASGTEMTFGTATTNGGNVYIAAPASLYMESCRISLGRAEKPNKPTATTMGGNLYCAGSFVMTGGDILAGYAYYGGNVQLQGATASFIMRGGSIYGGMAGYKTDVADLCTGQSSSENGLAQFRLEKGYIETAAYSQGKITLTGQNLYQETPMRVVVKVPGERLFIEGTYTGNINLVLNDANYLDLPAGSKIGNAVNADISGATINLLDYPDMEVVVQGSDLVLQRKALLAVNDTPYYTVSEGVAAYNTAGGWMKLLEKDLEITGLSRDLNLDLNGCNVAAVDTGSYSLNCKDTATDDYSSETAFTYGHLPAGTACTAAEGYLVAVTDGDGISFHKYELAVTEVNLRPANAGMYYTCTFLGDEAVMAQVSRFGVAMSLNTDMTEEKWIQQITQDSDCKTYVWYAGSAWTVGQAEANGVLVQNILREELTDAENQYRAELPISGVNFVELSDGTWLFGNSCCYSFREAMELANDTLPSFSTALLRLYKTYKTVMADWDVPKIAQMSNKI